MTVIKISDGIRCDSKSNVGKCNSIFKLEKVVPVKDEFKRDKFIFIYQCPTCGATVLVDPT